MLVFLAVVAAWTIVAVFQRFIDNLTFGTLGLNPKSTRDTGIIFLVAILIFFVFIWLLEVFGIVSTKPSSATDASGPFKPDLGIEADAAALVGTGVDDGRSQAVTNSVSAGWGGWGGW